MKSKIQLNKSLLLNKVTITKLQESQMAEIKGGMALPVAKTCGYASCAIAKSCGQNSCNNKFYAY